MDKVPWNRAILNEFISLALLAPRDEKILKARVSGWSQTEMCHKLNVSQATITRTNKKLKKLYESVRKYSEILPENLDF